MVVQWLLCQIRELPIADNGNIIMRKSPAVVNDTVLARVKNNSGGWVLDSNKQYVMAEVPKYNITQWSAAYYPPASPTIALVRIVSPESIVFDSPYGNELKIQSDWDDLYASYPALRNKWGDQP